jgi:predicted transcriptional regulator
VKTLQSAHYWSQAVMLSRTKQALKLLKDNPKMTQAQAGKLAGIAQSTVSMALAQEKRTAPIRCKCCGQTVPYLREIFKK